MEKEEAGLLLPSMRVELFKSDAKDEFNGFQWFEVSSRVCKLVLYSVVK